MINQLSVCAKKSGILSLGNMTVKELLEVDLDGYHKDGYRDEGGRQPLRSTQAHVRCHEGDSDYQADFATGYVCT